jgi:hypothetical protein
MKYFNVAGPCSSNEHYMIDASTRLSGVEELIDMKLYYVIHAARQSGKTTYLLDLVKKLNAEDKYYALYCSLETLQGIEEAKEGIPLIIECIKEALRRGKIPNYEFFAENANYSNYAGVLNSELQEYCEKLDKPFVIFFDEADCLSESTLISFLRQLRQGYVDRAMAPFVHSVALIGMRNIRDFKAKIRDKSETLGSASPFNIITESLTLKNFTKDEITTLYKQHTEETGQIFEQTAIDTVFQQTCGQPWLVNAIAREVIVKILASDYSKTVTAEMIKTAIETIILRRDTHIDSLMERLKEERVRKIIEPVIIGESSIDRLSDDYLYVRDLGLIKEDSGIKPSNPIYAEVIVRMLSYNYQMDIAEGHYPYKIPRYYRNGEIDVNYLLTDFQQFWRENSDIWITKTKYQEAAPHLILNGFLQRVINGGGEIRRELATGRRRTDLCVVYEDKKYPIEIKIRRSNQTFLQGFEQIVEYMDILGCKEGWLLIFDQRTGKSWEDKIYYNKEIINDMVVNVFGV